MDIKRVMTVATVLILAGSAPLFAQFSSDYDWDNAGASNAYIEEAIPVGPFLFSPVAQLTWQRRDNIHFTPDNEVTDDVYLARLRLLFELPVYESYVRFSYTPQYRDYKDYPYEANWGHFFDIAGEFDFANGLRLGASYKYHSTAMETREVDPGGELLPGEDRHNKHYAELTLEYWFSERDALSVEGTFEDLKFDKEVDTYFYDYNRIRLGVAWLHQINPTLTMDVRYRHHDFEGDQTLPWRNSTSDEITVGFTGMLNDVITSGFAVGYKKTDQKQVAGAPQFSDFSGPLLRGHLSWEMAHGSTLRLDMLHTDYPSNYDQNAYYTALGGSLIYDYRRGRWYGQARVRLQNNDYEVPDTWFNETRSDDILTFGAGLGFRFTEYISLRLGYIYEDRDSIEAYSYKTNIISLGLVVGY